MDKRPVYTKYFSRDFTLATIEVWWRAEAVNPKIWTTKQQPFLPYIIFEYTGKVIQGFYNQQGIRWVEQLLIDEALRTGSFSYIEIPFRKVFEKIKNIYENEPILSHKELVEFLQAYESMWTWFEAVWWGWESSLFDLYKDKLGEQFSSLMKLRKETERFVPGSEATIRKSLEKLYPALGDLVAVLQIKEIENNTPPSLEILRQRASGYFFTNNELYVGASRSFVEEKFNIQFEEINVKADLKEFKGQSAFKGIVRGVAKVLYGVREIDKIKSGDIIVAPMTLPDFLPAMKRAAAFVTDEGGVVCHAAIMARELQKPCIVATKIATKALKDGDEIEVDAK